MSEVRRHLWVHLFPPCPTRITQSWVPKPMPRQLLDITTYLGRKVYTQAWGNGTGCPEVVGIPSLEAFKPGRIWPWRAWLGSWQPCPQQGGRSSTFFKIHSNLCHSMILWGFAIEAENWSEWSWNKGLTLPKGYWWPLFGRWSAGHSFCQSHTWYSETEI